MSFHCTLQRDQTEVAAEIYTVIFVMMRVPLRWFQRWPPRMIITKETEIISFCWPLFCSQGHSSKWGGRQWSSRLSTYGKVYVIVNPFCNEEFNYILCVSWWEGAFWKRRTSVIKTQYTDKLVKERRPFYMLLIGKWIK